LSDKITGLKEQIKGKITKNPRLVEQGHERKTGELKHKQADHDVSLERHICNVALIYDPSFDLGQRSVRHLRNLRLVTRSRRLPLLLREPKQRMTKATVRLLTRSTSEKLKSCVEVL
jgi:hypothetical protein